MHSKGLLFGVYLDAGDVTCAGFPGSLGHEAADVEWLASVGADYLWLDGCNLEKALMPEKYELWSRLLNQSGRSIAWEVSWPAYTFHRNSSAAEAGADPFNVDLWWHSAAVGHEFRFYNDNQANWLHILDIAAWTHEAGMGRFHRPGSWAFMDMLESGIGSLSLAESRAHYTLWVLMAQPLHLGLDLRSASADMMAVFENEEVVRLGANDTLAQMGRRVAMTDSRLNGTQVWMRELGDGSILVGLLNAESSNAMDTCTWTRRPGGFYQVDPPTPDGNLECYNKGQLEQAKADCCAAGLKQCASVDYNMVTGSGCSKRNDKGGWNNDTNFIDYVVAKGHPEPVHGPPRTICFNVSSVGLNPYSNTSIRDLWAAKDLGFWKGPVCASVEAHGMALLWLRQ